MINTRENDIISDFMSTHECIVSKKFIHKNVEPRFTTFGNRAGRTAIYDILKILDNDTKNKVLEMMENKTILI